MVPIARVMSEYVQTIDMVTWDGTLLLRRAPGRWIRTRPFPIVLVKCWKVAHWNAKKLPPNFLDIFYINLNLKLYFSLFTITTKIVQGKRNKNFFLNFKKIRKIEVFYEIVDFLVLDLCSKPKFCSRLLEPQKLLQTPKVAQTFPSTIGKGLIRTIGAISVSPA